MSNTGRPIEPAVLQAINRKSRETQKTIDRLDSEIYVSEPPIFETPSILKSEEMREIFEENARYMQRVNQATGLRVYGLTDRRLLTDMVISDFLSKEYLKGEMNAKSTAEREHYNKLRNKEIGIYKDITRTLKLDPGGRVYFDKLNVATDTDEVMNEF